MKFKLENLVAFTKIKHTLDNLTCKECKQLNVQEYKLGNNVSTNCAKMGYGYKMVAMKQNTVWDR